MGELTRRVLSALVFVPLVLGLSFAGGWALFLLVAIIVGRSSWELLRMAEEAGHRPARRVGVALALGWCTYLQLFGAGPELPVALMAAVLIGLVATLRGGVKGYTANALLTLGSVFYVALLGSAPLLLARRTGAEAPWLIAAVFGCVWLADAAAYGGGRLWGKRRLVPAISPGKTIVGFFCGLVGGQLPLLLAPQLPGWTWPQLAGLFLVAGLGSQMGDLVESGIKRDLGVKDAPSLIPGHGGMLDRFDSYLFAFPLVLIYTVALKG